MLRVAASSVAWCHLTRVKSDGGCWCTVMYAGLKGKGLC